ncbi:MAG: response regulator [Candidatus Solibacter sp.]
MDEKNGVTILIAEDDASIRGFVRSLLELEGYCVLASNDGDAALDQSRQCSGQIHLLLSDVRMPGSLDGFALAHEIRRERPGIRILLMSGEDWATCQLPLLAKPFTAAKLYGAIQAVLGGREPYSEVQPKPDQGRPSA